MALQPETKLGHYEIVAPIGAGGMGEVYRARDVKLDREVAIKVLPESLAADEERLTRFEREAKALAALNHANVATIHGFERDGECHFLVMELVEGEDLSERLARGPLSVDEAVPLFVQMARGLEAAHEKGIVHRDLKPANVKLSASEPGAEVTVKILDFGLATVLAPTPSAQADAQLSNSPTLTFAATQRGEILGTAPYMSPEQARGLPVDKRTDIWAFGVCLFEALTGRRAFGGDDVSVSLAKVIQGEPPWERLPPDLPPHVRKLLRRCLEKAPSERLHDIADARLELEDSTIEEVLRPSHRIATRAWWLVGATALTAGLVGLLLGKLDSRTPAAATTPGGVVRLTLELPDDLRINLTDPAPLAISRDGLRVAFSAISPQGRGIYLRSLDREDVRLLAGTEGGMQPFFSPDGDQIGFLVSGKAKKVAVSGGAAIDLVPRGVEGFAQSWGEDGKIVLTSSAGGLLSVDENGGAPQTLTTPAQQGGYAHAWAQHLPDGRLLFTQWGRPRGLAIRTEGQDGWSMLEPPSSFSSGRYLESGHLVFTEATKGRGLFGVRFDLDETQTHGTEVSVLEDVFYTRFAQAGASFSVSANGTLAYLEDAARATRLIWVDANGTEVEIDIPVGGLSNPRISPDGSKILMGSDQEAKLYVVNLEQRRKVPLVEVTETLSQLALWAPDGSVTLTSLRGGDWDLYRFDPASAAEAVLLVEFPGDDTPLAWTPDGDSLVFVHKGPQGYDLWLLRPDAAEEPEQLIATPAEEIDAALSADGELLAYVSNKSGNFEVYVTTFPPDGPGVAASNGGGNEPRWSPDGRTLFFRHQDTFYATEVRRQPSLAARKPSRLFERPYHTRPSPGWGAHYDVAPDGKRLLVVSDASVREIKIVLNWFEDLNRLLPPE